MSASQRIQQLLGAFFNLKLWYLMVSKKKNPGGKEKCVPCDHHFSSLSKPIDAKR